MKNSVNKTTSENLKNMIFYWIETGHVWCTLASLVEDVDEVGELYETSSWMTMDYNGEHMTLLDVNVHLERAEHISYDLLEYLNKSLPDMVRLCVKVLPEIFGKYQDRIDEDTIKKITDMLLEAGISDELYAYTTDEQYENFCEYVQKCCDEIFAEYK